MKIFTLVFMVLGTALAVAQDEATIRAGDQIEIRLGGVPTEDSGQISGAYQVDGQGFINMPHVGKIRAAGTTQSAIQSTIENAYRGGQIFTNPTITVNMTNQARFVNVSGDVQSPSRVPYTPDLTILSVVAACRGFTPYADQKKVSLMRDGEVQIVNFKKLQENPKEDIPLKPGDNVFVPQSPW